MTSRIPQKRRVGFEASLTTTLSRLGVCEDSYYGVPARPTLLLHREVPVTAKREDDMAAATVRRGSLRASHADREQVVEVLKAAFVQGLLTKDEFDVRVGQTLASRTYAELAALTADIPAGLIGAQSPRKPARARAPHPEKQGGQFMRMCDACDTRAGGTCADRSL